MLSLPRRSVRLRLAALAVSSSVVGLGAVTLGAVALPAFSHPAAHPAAHPATPGGGGHSSASSRHGAAAGRPNILMITSDDLSTLDLAAMPHVRKLIADQGVTFTDAIAPTPICAPARASLLTGQYAHNDGVDTISGPHGGYQALDESRTIATSLQSAGYDTLFTGKFLNGYGEHGSKHDVPPGWTDWRATLDPSTYVFFHPTLNVNGKLTKTHGYTTTVMSKQADEMLAAKARTRKPWFAWVSYVAPHYGGPIEKGDPRAIFHGKAAIPTTVPDPRDKGRYAGVPLPDRPDMFEAKRYLKMLPKSSPARRRVSRDQRVALRMAYDQRLEAVRGVDRAVARQVATLRRTGQLSNTVIIFSSDNGYATGEHNINGKLWHYSEILRIPMLMRGPGVPVDRNVETAITNPDVAATILGFAGAKPQRVLDGVDMRPWLGRPTQQRVIPIEGWPVVNGTRRLYAGVRVGDWTYIRLRHGRGEELYDRATDPYELHNLAQVPAAQLTLLQMRILAGEYRNCAGASCPKTFTPA